MLQRTFCGTTEKTRGLEKACVVMHLIAVKKLLKKYKLISKNMR